MVNPRIGNNGDSPFDVILSSFGVRITENLKLLFETKHLYQNMQVEYQDFIEKIKKEFNIMKAGMQIDFTNMVKCEWSPIVTANSHPFIHGQDVPKTIWFEALM
jgi:hypothetical protein